jgi:hypothetical protein
MGDRRNRAPMTPVALELHGFVIDGGLVETM